MAATPSSGAALSTGHGDTNCDFTVDVIDALNVMRFVSNLGPFPDCISAGDSNCNSVIEIVDALLMLQHSAGMPVFLPPGCPAFVSSAVPRILFGMGPEPDHAISTPLVQQAPVGMLTAWYNGTSDLNWMKYWKNGFISNLYGQGFALHLIVYSNDPETGWPCGRQYPISDQIRDDMVALAQIFAGTAS
ncbi:MAG TPA: hypothetical protein VNL15_02375, partial [Dehalococcoidia bacterium]|nr:hypothetical protein [Dehalococcoidia bacterium]